jgi:hypothetical protein
MRTRQTDALLTVISELRAEVERWKSRAESMTEVTAALRTQVREQQDHIDRLWAKLRSAEEER